MMGGTRGENREGVSSRLRRGEGGETEAGNVAREKAANKKESTRLVDEKNQAHTGKKKPPFFSEELGVGSQQVVVHGRKVQGTWTKKPGTHGKKKLPFLRGTWRRQPTSVCTGG
jgi:hypothetical protein